MSANRRALLTCALTACLACTKFKAPVAVDGGDGPAGGGGRGGTGGSASGGSGGADASADLAPADVVDAPAAETPSPKALGATCATFDECSSRICGGRCCSAPCTCPQPSPQNLFKNPGFESDLSGWTTIGVQWTSQDVDGCPFSGSVQVLSANGSPSQCISVTQGDYNFGGWFRNTDGNAYYCFVVVYSDPNCTGTATAGRTISGTDTTWTFQMGFVTVPPGNVSAMLRCDSSPNTFIDKLTFSTGGY